MEDITKRSVAAHIKALESGEYSSEDLTLAYLDKTEGKEASIGAFITVCPERAISDAKKSDARRREGALLHKLDGIPIAIKDNISTRGIATTCASEMLVGHIPPYDATVVENLKKAGMCLVGKLNMDEFAMGSSTENSAFKITKNPLDITRVAGGSSGGSAAAVAAREVPCALGSDTGGSVRQPASFCGTVGMKPTYGRVSRYGLVAFSPSLEQIGPITSNVIDNALLLGAIAGADPKDSTSLNMGDTDFLQDIGKGARGIRIGVPSSLVESASDDVKTAFYDAVKIYEKAGAEVSECEIPFWEYVLPSYYIISSAEASSNLARFDGVRYGHRADKFCDLEDMYKISRSEGLGREVKRRIMLGTFALSSGYYDEYYKKALSLKNIIRRELDKIFERYDVILMPTAPSVAYKIGEKTGAPIDMYKGDIFCVLANLAGMPALSVPCGKGEGGMPIGIQIMGKHFYEALLYRVGAVLEAALGGEDGSF